MPRDRRPGLRAGPADPSGPHDAGRPGASTKPTAGYAGLAQGARDDDARTRSSRRSRPLVCAVAAGPASRPARSGASSPKSPGAKYVAVNADESEPGTFKDRELMEIEPHRVLEGVALCCYAIGADDRVHLYPRRIRRARGPAATRPSPRPKPPACSASTASGRDVNVQDPRLPRRRRVHLRRRDGAARVARRASADAALAPAVSRRRGAVPPADGHQQRRDAGQRARASSSAAAAGTTRSATPPRNTGPKIFCLSGRVNRPGNYELPLGAVTIRELIDDYGQGVIGGKAVKGVLTGGRLGADPDGRQTRHQA